jgi:hypothetical protein
MHMCTTDIIQSSQAFYYIHETRQVMCTRLTPCSPCSHCSFAPLVPLDPLTWNPPCCDRIRPPCLPVARKLILCSLIQPMWPLARSPDPRGFPDPNIHLIRTTLRTRPKCSLTLSTGEYFQRWFEAQAEKLNFAQRKILTSLS